MSRVLLTFYGDDFTGSTDALEQLTLAGIRTMLFVEPPTPSQLRRFPGLKAVGVAGMARALGPGAMEKELRIAFARLRRLSARHVHYKVCSTFDSSRRIGSIGRVLEVGRSIFDGPFVPILAAAPSLGRYTIFGNHFARVGTGTDGRVFRLDRHPAISRHPVTPMTEADLRLHLARQTTRRVALFDVLQLDLPENRSRAALNTVAADKPDAILFDAVDAGHLRRIGMLLDELAGATKPLFSIGSSGIEAALAATWAAQGKTSGKVHPRTPPPSQGQLLTGSGSCSPVTSAQIKRALRAGFGEVALDARALTRNSAGAEIRRAVDLTSKLLASGRSVIVHTTRSGPEKSVTASLGTRTGAVLGSALGKVLLGALARSEVQRVCIAGGDTASFAARALGIEALEMVAPLAPGAPLCRAVAPDSPADGRQFVFKGGQVGAEDFFELFLKGNT